MLSLTPFTNAQLLSVFENLEVENSTIKNLFLPKIIPNKQVHVRTCLNNAVNLHSKKFMCTRKSSRDHSLLRKVFFFFLKVRKIRRKARLQEKKI